MTPEYIVHLVSPLVNIDYMVESQELLDAAVGLFALILLALSLSAYRKTNLRRMLMVSAAFGLFAVEVAVRQLDAIVIAIGYQNVQIVTTALDFIILLLFFIAVVTRK